LIPEEESCAEEAEGEEAEGETNSNEWRKAMVGWV
jgi:hypothetical protein